MPRFRPRPPDGRTPVAAGLSPDNVRGLIAEVLAPAHFFAGPTTVLQWEHAPVEEVPWEIFQGRLLDPAHSARRQEFEAWNVFLVEGGTLSDEPLLSVKLDEAAGQIHVVRAIYSYAWEGYHAGDNVYLSREVRKWVRELVGTVCLARFAGEDDLRDELICQVFRAVVGTSRLPLTSLEAPLPAFSLGELAYFYQPGTAAGQERAGPLRTHRELLERSLDAELSWLEKAKLLETLLHAVPKEELAPLAGRFLERWRSLGHKAADIPALLRTLFNEVSLSPWTDLVEKALAFLRALEEKDHPGQEELATILRTGKDRDRVRLDHAIGLLGHLLRQTCRHLTAYDLVTFHHLGANYPDALLLDMLLKEFLRYIERYPHHFLDLGQSWSLPEWRRRLRRALRQAWLLRRRYEGHLVPDAPTSQGENTRVLPASLPRVPEEQITQPHRRHKPLFADDPLSNYLGEYGRTALRQSILDLCLPREYRELGMALFLDRPLGAGKGPVEPDQTPLLSYEAFSPSIAERRLDWLAQHVDLVTPAEYDQLRQRIGEEATIVGIPVDSIASASRPGTVSLADARRVADDFVLLRTTTRAKDEFLSLFDFRPLAARFALDWLTSKQPVLIVGSVEGKGEPVVLLRVYDAGLRQRLELTADLKAGCTSRAGIEYPANGLHVRSVGLEQPGSGELHQRDLASEGIVVPPSGK